MRTGEQSIAAFCDQLAAATPAPGGGAAAAVAGAMGASLVSMVGGLTRGREKFQAVEEEMAAAQEAGRREADALLTLADEDQAAFNQVMAAFALPKSTPEEKAERQRTVQAAYQEATRTPLETMRHCLAVMRHALAVVEKGNQNAVSDGCVGFLLADAAFEGALWNVAINLGSIKDGAFLQEVLGEVARMRREREEVQQAFRGLAPDPVTRFLKQQ
ncbi:cyclodeaminase/cyclohydrolase family protein [Symbiobacterium terraclitae]|jgi:formiminotetrahydrofolate cyclodeaminase|uniref:cyclodeaminase/cyclohydrolase family protein n=1 Tax=Symbiobacterium terraclitae TaxID=557451 RepID=UPI0035B56AE5